MWPIYSRKYKIGNMSYGILILVLIAFCSIVFIFVNLQPMTVESSLGPHWTTGISMPRSIFEVSATVLDGKIYVAGGQAENGDLLDTLFVYDPKSGKWDLESSLPVALDHSALASYDKTLSGRWLP